MKRSGTLQRDELAFRGYVAGERVAEGTSGVVFRASSMEHAGSFGLKLFRSQDECQHEVAIRSLLVGELLAAGPVSEDQWAIVFSWKEGSPLEATTTLTLDAAARLVADTASQLDGLHSLGVRHGDVKPANILVDGTAFHLIDYSLSDFFRAPLRGATPAYLAPNPSKTGAADLYALGLSVRTLCAPMMKDDVSRDGIGTLHALRDLVHAITRPHGCPSAGYVARRAAQILGRGEPSLPVLERVRRAYLRLREDVLIPGTECSFSGQAATWVHDVVALREGVFERTPNRLASLDTLSKVRFLSSFGVPATAARLGLHDGDLVDEVVAQLKGSVQYARSRVALRSAAASVRALLEGALDDAEVEGLAVSTEDPDVLAAVCETWLERGEIGRASQRLHQLPPALKAEVARRQGDYAEAETYAESIEPEGERAAVCARIAFDRGDAASAARHLAHASGPRALEMQALLSSNQATYDAATRALREALLRPWPSSIRRRLWGVLGYVEHRFEHVREAEAAFEHAVRDAHAVGARFDEAVYLTGQASAQADLGWGEQAIETSAQALVLWERLSAPARSARVLLARAAAFLLAENPDEALESARLALRFAQEGSDTVAERFAKYACFDAGDAEALHGLDGLELRTGARVLLRDRAHPQVEALDAQARRDPTVDAWEWWHARVTLAPAAEIHALLVQVEQHLRVHPPPRSYQLLHLPRFVLAATRAGLADVAARLLAQHGAACRAVEPYWTQQPSPPSWLAVARTVDAGQLGEFTKVVALLQGRKSLREVFEGVLDALVLWTNAERAMVLTRIGDRLTIRSTRHLQRGHVDSEQRAFSTSIATIALREGRAVTATNAHDSPLHASVHALRLRSVLALPLVLRGQTLGVVYLDHRQREGVFGPTQIEWASFLATQAAAALSEARDKLFLRRALLTAQRAKRRMALELDAQGVELSATKGALLRVARDTKHDYSRLVGASAAMRSLLAMVDKVTDSDIPVLVLGESGTGKELVARAIHGNGIRSKAPFVSENCGALAPGLLDSTLFGHVRGAFTGAANARKGLFEIADGGTLFLDEVGELSLETQVRLLRVLQEGEVWPLGAERPKLVNVRIICATHRDLEALVQQRLFREDLLYRLHVVSVQIPPLRERAEDIPELVQHFLRKHGGGKSVRVEAAAMDALCRYGWPGNVRQLENEVRRALLVREGATIDVRALSPGLQEVAVHVRDVAAQEHNTVDASPLPMRQQLDLLERRLVEDALRVCAGNKSHAAQRLGVSRYGLLTMIARLGIEGTQVKKAEKGAKKRPSSNK